MKRYWDMDEITDGRKYTVNDSAKLGCEDCKGCSACCHEMGESIVLDPIDLYWICTNQKVTLQQLMETGKIALNMVDGVVLPHLSMQKGTGHCAYLDDHGRCSIHAYRPGICRLFPLGRWYENETFTYFLQVNECKKSERTMVKIKDWLGIEEIEKYEKYISEWHYFLKEWQSCTQKKELDVQKQMVMYILLQFYQKEYQKEISFYEQFESRLLEAKELLKSMQS